MRTCGHCGGRIRKDKATKFCSITCANTVNARKRIVVGFEPRASIHDANTDRLLTSFFFDTYNVIKDFMSRYENQSVYIKIRTK
jgi:hypothetical protein